MKLDLSRPVGYIYVCPACKKTFTLFASKQVTKEVGLMYCPKCSAIFDTVGIPPQVPTPRKIEFTKIDKYLVIPEGTSLSALVDCNQESINILRAATAKYGVIITEKGEIRGQENRAKWLQLRNATGYKPSQTRFVDFDPDSVVLENLGETLVIDHFKQEGRPARTPTSQDQKI